MWFASSPNSYPNSIFLSESLTMVNLSVNVLSLPLFSCWTSARTPGVSPSAVAIAGAFEVEFVAGDVEPLFRPGAEAESGFAWPVVGLFSSCLLQPASDSTANNDSAALTTYFEFIPNIAISLSDKSDETQILSRSLPYSSRQSLTT